MLLVEEQRSLALEILDAFEISNPRVEEAIRQLRVTASTSDPIEAIVLFHKDEMEQKPATGAVSILRDLISLQANATQADDLELAERVEKEINERELDASQNYSAEPEWIEYQFSRALLNQDWPAALESAQSAERLNVDQVSGKPIKVDWRSPKANGPRLATLSRPRLRQFLLMDVFWPNSPNRKLNLAITPMQSVILWRLGKFSRTVFELRMVMLLYWFSLVKNRPLLKCFDQRLGSRRTISPYAKRG